MKAYGENIQCSLIKKVDKGFQTITNNPPTLQLKVTSVGYEEEEDLSIGDKILVESKHVIIDGDIYYVKYDNVLAINKST